MTARGCARSFGYMNPSAFIEAAAAADRAVFGALVDPVVRSRTGSTSAASRTWRRHPNAVAAILALIVAMLALSSGVAHAAAGDLDPTFGTGGRQVFIGVTESAVQTLVHPDGKIVLVIAP